MLAPGGPCGKSRDTGKNSDDGKDAFTDHAAVSYEMSVFLIIELSHRRSGRNKTVESGDGAAGYGDEQKRHKPGRSFRVELYSRRYDFGMDHKHAAIKQDEAYYQLLRVDVVPGLKQCPDREYGRNEGIYTYNIHPGHKPGTEKRGWHLQRILRPEPDGEIHQHQSDERWYDGTPFELVDGESNEDGQYHLTPDGDYCGGESVQKNRYDQRENRNHNPDQKQHYQQEKRL